MDVQIWSIDPVKMAYAEHTGPYNEIGAAWEKLCAWAGPAGHFNATTRFYGVFYDDPATVEPQKLRSEACITVGADVPASADINVRDFQGGKYAVAVHLGPYEKLVDSWSEFYGSWLPGSGMDMGQGPCMEQYMNDPMTTKPEHLVTLLLLPLK
ncbi:GyrI-like domain-containing protein [Maridesulfovibrio sp.]|uniref:AraC family transcriptional regulator n=1 Tax=Maridesulfovibrio sp. TaxID=2795000 RepID=UPI002A186BB0|nr:GyrI-like domain-containing protein [Maridesulfovibrio sp.]